MWIFPVGLIVLVIAAIGTHQARANSLSGTGGTLDPSYPPAVWGPIVASLIGMEFPSVNFKIAMKWMSMESDGSPCAFGSPNQRGKDGNPREIGLGQIYNSPDGTTDDFDMLGLRKRGVTPSTYRAYCVPGTQRRSRSLTSDEMTELVRGTLLAKIDQCRKQIDSTFAQYGITWSVPDYWKMVKAPHAWPPIVHQGLPAVVKKLGRAPKDWIEFRQVLGMDHDYMWKRGLDNCEKCASVLVDQGANV